MFLCQLGVRFMGKSSIMVNITLYCNIIHFWRYQRTVYSWKTTDRKINFWLLQQIKLGK